MRECIIDGPLVPKPFQREKTATAKEKKKRKGNGGEEKKIRVEAESRKHSDGNAENLGKREKK